MLYSCYGYTVIDSQLANSQDAQMRIVRFIVSEVFFYSSIFVNLGIYRPCLNRNARFGDLTSQRFMRLPLSRKECLCLSCVKETLIIESWLPLISNELFARLWFARDWKRVAAFVVRMCNNRLDNEKKNSLLILIEISPAITAIYPTINISVAASCYLRPVRKRQPPALTMTCYWNPASLALV
jgi:hypothetical protein